MKFRCSAGGKEEDEDPFLGWVFPWSIHRYSWFQGLHIPCQKSGTLGERLSRTEAVFARMILVLILALILVLGKRHRKWPTSNSPSFFLSLLRMYIRPHLTRIEGSLTQRPKFLQPNIFFFFFF